MSKFAPHRPSASNPRASHSTICQKCLGTGHFTYQCRNTRPYVSRPSRTEQLEKPQVLAKLRAEGKPSVEVPEEFMSKKGTANKILEAKEKKRAEEKEPERKRARRSSSHSSSSSSDSESDSHSDSSGSDSDSDSTSGSGSSSHSSGRDRKRRVPRRRSQSNDSERGRTRSLSGERQGGGSSRYRR